MVRETMRSIHAEGASLLVADPTSGVLSFEVALTTQGPQTIAIHVQPGEGIAGSVAQQGQTLLIADVAKDPRFSKEISRLVGFPVRSILCAPVKSGHKTLGVVEFLNNLAVDDRAFTEEDVAPVEELAGALTKPIAALITRRGVSLDAAPTSEQAAKELSALLPELMDEAKRLMTAEASSLLLVDEETGDLSFEVALGERGERVKSIHVRKGEGVAGWVAENGKSLLVPDAAKDPRHSREIARLAGFPVKSIVCAPLIHRKKVIGVVQAINNLATEDRSFAENDVAPLEDFAERAAAIIARAKYPQSETDPRHDLQKVEDLLAMLDITRHLSATTKWDDLVDIIGVSVRKVLECERSTVFLHDQKTDELYSKVDRDRTEIRFPSSKGIAGEAFHSCTVIHVPDAYADPRFNPAVDRQTGFKTRNMLTFPLIGIDNKPVGVLQVLNKKAGPFTAWDQQIMAAYGAQTGVALQRQLLLQEYAEKQKIEHNLDIARQIQQGIIPKSSPTFAGFEIAGWNRPADETGGDYFDFQRLDDDSLAVSVCDVSGHGIGPALVVSECRALTRALFLSTKDLARVVGHVNELLSPDLPDDRFVTALFGILHSSDGRLEYISAGHGPLLLLHADTGVIDRIKPAGPPLGVAPEIPYDAPIDILMKSGDIFLVFTDGFFEWANGANEEFGLDRLCEVIANHQRQSAKEIVQAMYAAVLTFAEGSPQMDDLTVMVVKKS